MLIALIARDRDGALETRTANRSKHLSYIEDTGVVAHAGPLVDDGGVMVGSLIILDVEDMDTARSWAESDPYAKAGLFETVELIQWKKVIG